MVDVTHDHHNGRALHQIGGVVLFLHKQAFLDGNMDFMLYLGVEFLGNEGGGVKIHHVGHSVHLAHLHELGHDLGSGLLAGGLVLALVGHVAAVGQVVVPGIELIHVHIHGTGIHRHLGAVHLDLFGSGHRLLDAGIGGQLLQGDPLFGALFRLLLGLAGLTFGLGLFLLSLFGGRLLFLGFGRFFHAAGQVGVKAGLCILARQRFQQEVQFLLTKGSTRFVSLAGQGRNGLDDLLGGHAELLGDICDLVFKIHKLWSSSASG